jgi:hypothetical protein
MKVTKINSGGYVKDIYMPSGKVIKVAIRYTDATKQYWELFSPALWKFVEKDKNLLNKFPNGFGIFEQKRHAVKCLKDIIQDVLLNEIIETLGDKS